ncbi:MAG: substrate-binding domain-containing protein [Clostridia bacterium]|nr:substrate-binding domain-containing protein [Clostridia bacterium]
MKRLLGILLSIALFLVCLSFAAVAEDEIYIGVCIQGNQSGFLQYVCAGIWEYQKNNEPDVKVEVVFADDDAAKQLSQVETFISKGVDAIVLNPVDKVQSAAAVDAAYEKNIPVITVNTISDSEHVAAHVGSDDVESGILQMERLLSVCGPEMKVVYIDAVLGHSAQVGRSEGYNKVISENPGVTLVDHDTGNWSPDDSMRLVENWLEGGVEFDAIACMADCQLIGVVTAIENAGLIGKVKLSGMDCDPEIMQAIVDGKVDSSIWQDGVGQGSNALRLAIAAARGEEVSDYLLPYEVCSVDNIDEYLIKAEERNELARQYF